MNAPLDTRRISELSPLKLALAARSAREKNQALLRADPIAIIGMGCRLPGNVDGPQAFWTLLADGVDAVSEVPPGRWDVAALYDPDPSVPGKSATKWGGYVGDIDRFDAGFFGIMRREAERMDPQQRLFLEVAIEALDHAGQPREKLAGSRVGVYIASYYNDYAQLSYQDPDSIDARTLTGTVHSVLANRLSYLLDLRGPSISVDTACSSSLVAIHLACQSLRFGECEMAIAGGVSLMVTESLMISLSKVGFMAPDGRCKTFDASADGFGRGEGCGVIVLKRLSDAIADGDRVLALVRGSAVNQDGHSTLMAAPNGLAQQALIREALDNAQIDASRVGYVEAHGTGTPLGDPIEVEALAATVGVAAPGAAPCFIGTAKANVGHLEAAAGVTGVIKSVLVLQNAQIPAQVHYSQLNPHILLAGTRLAIPGVLTPWTVETGTRCLGVSGFGVGGTNAHLIMEEAPKLPPLPLPDVAPQAFLLPLSAQSRDALEALARRWVGWLRADPVDAAGVCACAGARRSHYAHRIAVVGGTVAELAHGLEAFLAGHSSASHSSGSVDEASVPRLAFVFGGQGQQWVGMGRELLETEPVFRAALEDVDQRFRRLSGWSILNELRQPEDRSRLEETEVAQPAIFAIQASLAKLWASWGFVPEGVTGHSVGEIAALHVAGVLTLDEALRIVLLRARAMQGATGAGAMVAVALTESQACRYLDEAAADVSVAAVNGPRSVVLSGGHGSLERAVVALKAAGVEHKVLPVNYAFHSAQMEECARGFQEALGIVATSPAVAAVYSTVTGARLALERASRTPVDAGYFAANVRSTVRFAAAIDAMLADGFGTFLELSAHPVLGASIAECAAERELPARPLASMRRARPARETLLQTSAWLYATLQAPSWDAINGEAAGVVDLPSYPWQRERYWLPKPASQVGSRSGRGLPSGHELLGDRLHTADAIVFEASWPESAARWLEDHRIGGRLLLPAAAMVESLRAAATRALAKDGVEIADFIVHEPLALGDAGEPGVTWQTTARLLEDGRVSLSLHWAQGEGGGTLPGWRMVASATASARPASAAASQDEPWRAGIPAAGQPGAGSVRVPEVYAAFESLGIGFGPAFRVLQSIEKRDSEAIAWLDGPGDFAVAGTDYLHPTLLDGALQACLIADSGRNGVPTRVLLPVGIERYRVYGSVPARLCALVAVTREGTQGSLRATVRLVDEHGRAVASLDGVRFAPASARALARRDAWNHELAWRVVKQQDQGSDRMARPPGAWILLSDAGGQADDVAGYLGAIGHRCLRIDWDVEPAGTSGALRRQDARQQWDAALADSGWRQGLPLAGVVNMLAIDGETGVEWNDAGARASISVMQIVQAMAAHGLAQASLILVTQGVQAVSGPAPDPRGAGLWGLHGVIAVEHPEFNCRIIDLDGDAASGNAAALASEIVAGRDAPPRLAIRSGQRLLPRLRRSPVAADDARPVHLLPGATGTLDDLAWQTFARPLPGPDEVVVRVAAAGINFRDVLLALGMYPDASATLGAECAGIVTAVGSAVNAFQPGDAVFGFVPDSLATETVVADALLCKLPDTGLTMERAAALPVAFLTAMFGLHHLAGLQAGQRVLIHAAAGGVGMAAVQLARRAGAEVLATAGSPAKRQLLKSLGVAHVFDSRTLDFADRIREVTGGAGVDVVLNSLAGDFIAASIGVLAPGGWFLELGKRDIWSEAEFSRTRPDARYRAYDLGDEIRARPALVRPMMAAILAGLADASLQSLPVRVYDYSEAAEAFKFMAQARHTGKLVLRNTVAPPTAGFLVRPDAAYLISGGFGGLGQETARWLAGKGARHLILIGRRRPGPDAEEVLGQLRGLGVRLEAIEADVADESAMRALLARIAQDGLPLRGVFHAAGGLEDGVLLRQDPTRFESAFSGKAAGARILDRLTRTLPLDCFVLFASVAQWLGAPGQGPYAAANAEAEGIVRARTAVGLPGLAVAWGQWSDKGMAARMALARHDAWSERGLGWIAPAQGLDRLDQLLSERATTAIVLPIDWARFLRRLPTGADADFFAGLAVGADSPAAEGRRNAGVTRAAQWLGLAESQRRGAVLAHVCDEALNVLGLDPGTRVDSRTPLKELGLDSLMAVELRNALTRSTGSALSATLLFDYPSLAAVTDYLMQKLNLATQPPGASAAGSDPADDDDAAARAEAVAEMSDAEADAQLLAELDGPAARSRL